MEAVHSQSLHAGIHSRTGSYHAESKSFAKKMKTKLTKAKISRSKIRVDDADSKQTGAGRMFSDVSNGQGTNDSQNIKPAMKKAGVKRLQVVHATPSKKIVVKPVELCPQIAEPALQQVKESDLVLPGPRLPAGVVDIDNHERNCFKEPEYAEDVMDYLREQERRFFIPSNYLYGRTVTHSMRTMLVDWLIQVQDHLGLEQETLHLGILLLDHFLFRQAVSVAKVQLIGITCLFVAAKFIERFAPEIKDLVRLTDDTYSYDQVIRMELVVLKVMRFELHMPDPTVFVNRFLDIEPVSEEVQHLSNYLLDLGLISPTLITTPSSVKAAAAVALAKRIFSNNNTTWSNTMGWYTRFRSESSLHPTMRKYVALLQKVPSSKQNGAYNKYCSRSKYRAVAKSPELHPTGLLNKILVSITPGYKLYK